MNEENTQKRPLPELWSFTQISLAAYIAGPFAGCYLLGKNFKELACVDYSRYCYFAGVLLTILILGTLPFIPENWLETIPHSAIPGAYSLGIAAFGTELQKKLADREMADGVKRRSYWRCFLWTLILMAIQAPFVFLYLIFLDSIF